MTEDQITVAMFLAFVVIIFFMLMKGAKDDKP